MRNNLLRILILMLAICFVVSIAACGEKEDKTENTEILVDTTTLETESYETQPIETVETTSPQAGGEQFALCAVYTPQTVYDEEGNELSLLDAFGTAYASYGGELYFNEDKSFTLSIGVNKGDGIGTYKVTSDNEVTLNYENGEIAVITITETDVDEGVTVATELSVPYNGFTVIFA